MLEVNPRCPEHHGVARPPFGVDVAVMSSGHESRSAGSITCHNEPVVANQLDAVGVIYAFSTEKMDPLGSCFLFRSDVTALTAAHCVPNNDHVYIILFPNTKKVLKVERVERHPIADIAILFCAGEDTRTEQSRPAIAFWDGVGNFTLGEEFVAFGYPTEGPTESAETVPVPRVFIGHFQRIMPYVSPRGYRYLAGELSIPAPGGLSGGPVFRRGAQKMVLGMVAANLESYAVTDSVLTVDDDGKQYREEARRVIRYGLAVMLSGVGDWLNERSPRREGGYVLRQEPSDQ